MCVCTCVWVGGGDSYFSTPFFSQLFFCLSCYFMGPSSFHYSCFLEETTEHSSFSPFFRFPQQRNLGGHHLGDTSTLVCTTECTLRSPDENCGNQLQNGIRLYRLKNFSLMKYCIFVRSSMLFSFYMLIRSSLRFLFISCAVSNFAYCIIYFCKHMSKRSNIFSEEIKFSLASCTSAVFPFYHYSFSIFSHCPPSFISSDAFIQQSSSNDMANRLAFEDNHAKLKVSVSLFTSRPRRRWCHSFPFLLTRQCFYG